MTAIKLGLAAVLGVATMALSACGGGRSVEEEATARIGVNSFLWLASLETVEFMPLESADSQAGLILTDWYVNPQIPEERFKAKVFILDTRLRADALKVAVTRQTFDEIKGWISADTAPETEIQIENAILNRARELRIATLER